MPDRIILMTILRNIEKYRVKESKSMGIKTMLTAICATTIFSAASVFAGPSAQIMIPSTDVKALKEVAVGFTYIGRFGSKKDAGASSYDIGVTTGLLPFESLKLEVGIDYLTSNLQDDNYADNHPFYFNTKLGTPEDAFGIKGLPAFAVGMYGLGTYDKAEIGSTRQNIVYGLVAKTLPVIGRLSAGGYHGSKRALATAANPSNTNMNSGLMTSWDRSMPEISDKLWLGVDYLSGNNANGEMSLGASWAFSKQVTVLAGMVFFNPFYKPSATGDLPGGKPAYTIQLTLNLP
jgi:hypothetical protein